MTIDARCAPTVISGNVHQIQAQIFVGDASERLIVF